MESTGAGYVVDVDVDRYIWKYMNQSAKYRARIEQIGREGETTLADTDVEGGQTRLSVAGGDGEKMRENCSSRLLELVDECRQTVSTYTMPGQDEDACGAVADNASLLSEPDSAQVDVDPAAGVMRLTGTADQIKNALGILEILGVPIPGDLPV